MFLPVSERTLPGEFTLTIFDVGQGLAVLTETQNQTLLYDTGAGLDAQNNVANSSIIPFLRKRNIRSLSALVISHGDNDHSGGAAAVLKEVQVRKIFISGSVEIESAIAELCEEKVKWEWDGVKFQFLNQSGSFDYRNSNNGSCVLKVSGVGGSVLLPGDIEAEAEYDLSAHYKELLASTVLIAPHHGSKTSSSYAFIKRVLPEQVVYSAAYKSQFGHPAVEIQEKYLSYKAVGYSTAELGMISFEFRQDNTASGVSSFRRQHPRYWRHQAFP
ncbi:MAG: MBL fold metallo-hydrolase [Pseudomonadales bacterium]|nr:MBL fold metallo-hydrolase [Pseudomonadales bacterium]